MITLDEALNAARTRMTRKGRGPRPTLDWEAVIRTFFDCRNQHTTAARLGLRQGRVSAILRYCGVRLGRGKRDPVHPLPMEEVTRDYRGGTPTTELGRRHGVDPEVIRRRLRSAGVDRRPRGQYERRGSDNPQWKGGREETMHYYRRQAYEVAAICFGQPLPRGTIIHHCDEDPKNNQPCNLLLFENQSAHGSFHQLLLERQQTEPEVDAIRLALENGARRLPLPPNPIVLPPDIEAPAPRKKRRLPASARRRTGRGQFVADPQPEPPQ
jgi:HNH endonuclease